MSRQERVKVERPGVKGVLAFFLLPQFWRSFGHFAHIKPTFIRTLALMLEQSGLLPVNHPATRYIGGQTSDGQRITIHGIMGEAWYHLRTRKGMGVYQWSMFGSLVMMFAIFVGAMGMAVVYILSGAVAEAQIFNLAAGNTDLTAVPNYGGLNGFDVRDPGAVLGAGGTPDLAIGILDKVLRQGAVGTGGALQDGIAVMYGTYSSAVLIIASIMVFWSIVSIVVDSARTGQFGGGRHNMVWTPIRFVFALGILVPIGGGFSSGQMLIMKLAELGSNLGTNMWSTYVSATANADMLVSNLTAADPRKSVIEPYLNALICMKRENIETEVSKAINYAAYPVPTPFPPPAPGPSPMFGGIDIDLVREVIDNEAAALGPVGIPVTSAELAAGKDTYSIAIGNDADFKKCGNITVSNPNADFLNGTTPLGVAIPAGAIGRTAYYLPDAIAIFKRAQRQAEITALTSVKAQMELYACAMAGKEQSANPATAEYPLTCPVGVDGTADGVTIPLSAIEPISGLACNALPAPILGGWTGRYPATLCKDRIVNNYLATLNPLLYGGGAIAGLTAYVTGAGPGSLVFEAQSDGWAGMGAWYYKIAQINRTAASSQKSSTSAAASIKSAPSSSCPVLVPQILCDFMDMSKSVWDGGADIITGIFDEGFVQYSMKELQMGDSVMLVDIGQWGQTTHPIAQLAVIGDAIVDKSLSIYNWIMFVNLLGAIPFLGGAIEAIMAGPVGGLLGMFASFGMMPGIMLLYYVPLIPWIRVTFAVLAWIVSVIEAVTTLPIVALAHLRTDGEGLAGPMAQSAYTAWLNLLLRPGLTVIGFVMGGLVFQTMVLYSNDTFQSAMSSMGSGGYGILDQVINTYIYVMVVYALVNASFKLVDIIPNTTMGWLGGPGAQDFSGESAVIESGINQLGGEFAQGVGQSMGRSGMTDSMRKRRGNQESAIKDKMSKSKGRVTTGFQSS